MVGEIDALTRWGMSCAAILLAALASSCFDGDAPAQRWIDAHVHASLSSEEASASELYAAMDSLDVNVNVVMPFPAALTAIDELGEREQALARFFDGSEGRVQLMFGGEELQPILHALGRPTEFELSEVYPNGTGPLTYATDEAMQRMTEIAENPEEYEARFMELARWAAESGLYIGFGELAPLHLSFHSGHPYITYPPDHQLMLWLSDLAADHDMVLEVHLEATEETLEGLSALLTHNHETRIVWSHVGWSSTGLATADVVRAMLEDHENLFVNIKLELGGDPPDSNSYPLDSSGVLKSDWRTLLEDHAGRIMIGTDVKYWLDVRGDPSSAEEEMARVNEPFESLLSQLPSGVQDQIRVGTAVTLFGL